MTKFYREQKVELFYFTDPVCFDCWTHESHLIKFLQLYSDYLDLHIIMSGRENLDIKSAEVCNNFKYSKENKLLPSKVFRVFTAVAPQKSVSFLRLIRWAIFAEKIDISDEKNLIKLIQAMGERGREIIECSKDEAGERRLQEDLRLGKQFDIIEIPSLVMVHDGKSIKITERLEENKLKEELSSLLGFVPNKNKLRSLEEELEMMGRLCLRDLCVLYELEKEGIVDFVAKSLDEKQYRWVDYDGGKYLEAVDV